MLGQYLAHACCQLLFCVFYCSKDTYSSSIFIYRNVVKQIWLNNEMQSEYQNNYLSKKDKSDHNLPLYLEQYKFS